VSGNLKLETLTAARPKHRYLSAGGFMGYNKVDIAFEKFNPKEELRRLFVTVADKLHMDAPSDSHVRLVMKKGKETFSGYCRIASNIGVFIAEECAPSPEGALAKIEKKISRQLMQWKSRRFRDAAEAS
jgi:hypothetical protein